MSDDLIGREAVIKELTEWKADAIKWAWDGPYQECYQNMIETLSDMPIAFDKEKVVEKIKDYRDLIPEWALKEIIEVVEKGGIE